MIYISPYTYRIEKGYIMAQKMAAQKNKFTAQKNLNGCAGNLKRLRRKIIFLRRKNLLDILNLFCFTFLFF